MTPKCDKHAIPLWSIILVFLSTTMGLSQLPGYSIVLSRTDFETGVAFPIPESFATATVGCRFDDWAKTVNWGDGTTETLTHTVGATLPGPSTPAGTYAIYSTHSYAKARTYAATAQLYVHCYGQGGGKVLVDEKSYSIAVFDRLPLRVLTPSSDTVRKGGSLNLTVETYADAPDSGTRVEFTADKPDVFGPGAFSAHSDIPPKNKTTLLTLTVLPNAPEGPVKIFAKAGSELSTTINIMP